MALFVAMIAVAVDGAFSGNFVVPVSQVWIAVLFGWVIAWIRPEPVDAAPKVADLRSTWARTGVVLCLCVSQAWLCWACWGDPRDPNGRTRMSTASPTAVGKLCPRFWASGWF
jgi:hypothetical protein